jgi:hypothetical protein
LPGGGVKHTAGAGRAPSEPAMSEAIAQAIKKMADACASA